MSTLAPTAAALGATELLQVFVHFMLLSLLAIGGAITTTPEMQRWVVGERGWLTDATFTDSVAIAQAAPGPNLLFVAVVGWNLAGGWGVLATMAGSLLPSTTLTLLAARYGTRHETARAVRAFKAGLAPVTLGMLVATGWVLLQPLRALPAAWALVAATVVFMHATRASPVWMIALGAAVGGAGWLG